jgi:hypothetical protein
MLSFTIDNPFQIAIIIYLFIIAILFILKPKFIFDNPKINYKFGLADKENNKIKKKKKTIMPLWLLFLILAIVIYYIVVTYTCQQNQEYYCQKILKGDLSKIIKNKCI